MSSGYRLPSGSTLGAQLACPGRGWLPQHPQPESEAAARGTGVHAFIERALNNVKVMQNWGLKAWLSANEVGEAARQALASVPDGADYRAICETLDLSTLLGEHRVQGCEVSFAVELDSGRVRYLGEALGRAYEVDPEREIPLTIDGFLTDVKGTPVALEVKTGSPDKVTPLSKANAQVMLGAYCLISHTGAEEASGRLVFVRPGGQLSIEQATWSHELLRGWWDMVRAALKRESRELIPGQQCEWCPCFQSCPAQVRLITALARLNGDESYDGSFEYLRGSLDSYSPEETERALSRLEAYKLLLKRLEALFKERPRVLPGGRVYRPVKTTRKVIDPQRAAEALGSRWPHLEVVSHMKRSLSADALRKLCKAGGVPYAQAQRVLTEAGAYVTEEREEWRITAATDGDAVSDE